MSCGFATKRAPAPLVVALAAGEGWGARNAPHFIGGTRFGGDSQVRLRKHVLTSADACGAGSDVCGGCAIGWSAGDDGTSVRTTRPAVIAEQLADARRFGRYAREAGSTSLGAAVFAWGSFRNARYQSIVASNPSSSVNVGRPTQHAVRAFGVEVHRAGSRCGPGCAHRAGSRRRHSGPRVRAR